MSILTDQLKLEIKSLHQSNLAQFISTKPEATICLVPNDSTSHFVTLSSLSEVARANTDTYITLHSQETEIHPMMFNNNSINFGNDTLLKGNLIIFGNIITLGYDVLTENNQDILNNYGASAEKGLNSISQKAINNITNYNSIISNNILNYTLREIQSMRETLGIQNIISYPNNVFTSYNFNDLFNKKSLDDILQGSSNKYFINDEYHSTNPLIIDGKLVASNIHTQNIYIDGNVYTDVFYGNGANIININQEYFNTNFIIETSTSSNQYFTFDKISAIINSCNQQVSNYINDIYIYNTNSIANINTSSSNIILNFTNSILSNYSYQKQNLLNVLFDDLNCNVINVNEIFTNIYNNFNTVSNNIINYNNKFFAFTSNNINEIYNDIDYNIKSNYATSYYTLNNISNYLYYYLINDIKLNHENNLYNDNYVINISSEHLNKDTSNFIQYHNEKISQMFTNIYIPFDTHLSLIEQQNLLDYLYHTSNMIILQATQNFEKLHNKSHENSNNILRDNGNIINNLSNYILSTLNETVLLIDDNNSNITSTILEQKDNTIIKIKDLQINSNVKFENIMNYIQLNTNFTINQKDIIVNSYNNNDKIILLNKLTYNLENVINNLNSDYISSNETSSNIYYSYDLFFNSLYTKTLDDLHVKSSNNCIINNLYNSNLSIYGDITAQNVKVFGDNAIFNTFVYDTEVVNISNYENMPSIKLENHNIDNDIMVMETNTNPVFIVHASGDVTINSYENSATLDVYDILNSDYLYGSGSLIHNVNISDKTTADLMEGTSNLYYTDNRVSLIVTSSNILTSNYIQSISNTIHSNMILNDIYACNLSIKTCEDFISLFSDKNLAFSNYTDISSNELLQYINAIYDAEFNIITNTSNAFIEKISNILYNYADKTYNDIININNTLNSNTSNYCLIVNDILTENNTFSLTYSSNYISLLKTDIDDLMNYNSQGYSNEINNISNLLISSYGTKKLLDLLYDKQITLSLYQSNLIEINSNLLVNFCDLNTSNLLIYYGTGSTYIYRYTYDFNIVHINFKNKKIINQANSEWLNLSYNSSNLVNIYPVIDNFTIFHNNLDYFAANSYAFQSTSNMYIYMQDEYSIKQLLTKIHKTTFSIHFVFKVLSTNGVPIYTLCSPNTTYLAISIKNGLLVCTIGNNEFYANKSITTDVWYTVDLIFDINTDINLEIYIDLELLDTYTELYRNEFLYDKGSNITMYLGIYYGDNDDIVYIQDFRIFSIPTSSTQVGEIKTLTSNVLYYGTDCDNIISTKNTIIDPVRWIESSSYDSNYFNSFNRYITYNGNTGISIGKSDIPEATLDVYTDDPTVYSIKTNNPIWIQSSVLSSSDRRIKTNIRDISYESAIKQLLAIEPKSYDYIDKTRSNDKVYGFSAQQIKKIIPNSVSLNTDVIPNIYCRAKLTNRCIVQLINSKHNIQEFSIILLYYNNISYRENVVSILNDTTFKIENKAGIPNTEIFVYGEIVRDFHTLDKNYIYTLSVCAIQELHEKHQQLSNIMNIYASNLPNYTCNLVLERLYETSYHNNENSILSLNSMIDYNNNLQSIDRIIRKIKSNITTCSQINIQSFSELYDKLQYIEETHKNVFISTSNIIYKLHDDNIENMKNEIDKIENILLLNGK